MASRRTDPVEKPGQRFLNGLRWGRFVIWLVLGVCTMVGTLFAWHRTEEFLIQDDRFRLPEAEEYTGQNSNLLIEGIHYASPSQIRHVFAPDFGRSLYLVPLQERRRELLAIDWVEEAAVSKIWPGTLKVKVQERVPVAFVHLRPGKQDGASQFALIDRGGYILRPRLAAKFTLPVITGLSEADPLGERRIRVRRVLQMLKEVGSLTEQISEINAADPNNLVVAERIDNRVLNLILGEENYSAKLQNFLANYGEIRAKRPDATTLDLRVDGVITAVGEQQHGE